ncbi:hypothetical protein QQF64_033933 [Cirrhinus molitorella]|uniref:Retrotransposon gag domain-containing protein n=1 Tax=Cirrhinus molitorella TaxID=172907 RepID=A0ABR3MVK4_9TELE
MDSTTSVPKFDCYSEPATLGPRWTRWLSAFELFADGKGLLLGQNASDATKQRRRALLLHHAGTDVQDIFSTLENTGTTTEYDTAVAALNAYFIPRVNTALARQSFYQVTQRQGETVQQFVTRLRQAAKDCDFGVDKDNQLRDAVLSKCSSDYIKRKLLEEGTELTLTRTLEIAMQCERVELQMSAMHISQPENEKGTVNHVVKRRGKYQRTISKQTGEKKETVLQMWTTGSFGQRPNLSSEGPRMLKCVKPKE